MNLKQKRILSLGWVLTLPLSDEGYDMKEQLL